MNGETIVLVNHEHTDIMLNALAIKTENSTDILSINETLRLKDKAKNDGCKAMIHGILLKQSSSKDESSPKKASNHIRFRDMVSGQRIADVLLVESYKEYNILLDDPGECACAVL